MVDIVLERVPATLLLMGTATAIAVVVGVATGVTAAFRRNGIFDYVSATLALLALSLPTFWLGLLAIFAFAQTLGWLPADGMTDTEGGGALDRLHHLIPPALVLAFVLVAQWSRYTRSALFGYGSRAALVPLVTLAGLQLPTLFGGALVMETVVAWLGMGALFVNAPNTRDYSVLMAILMMTAVLVVVRNLLADLAAALIDPRIRASRA